MFGPITFLLIASSSVRYSLMETGRRWLFSLRKKSISMRTGYEVDKGRPIPVILDAYETPCLRAPAGAVHGAADRRRAGIQVFAGRQGAGGSESRAPAAHRSPAFHPVPRPNQESHDHGADRRRS